MKLLINYSPEELDTHKKGQSIMADMLKEFDHICRSNGLKYWCVGGTLIGAVRHKGWIPHDADIDVAMLKSDYVKLQNIIQEKLSKDYWFQDISTDKYYKSSIGKIRYLYAQYDDWKCQDWHNGIQLDIFITDYKFNKGDIFPGQNKKPIVMYQDGGRHREANIDLIFPLKELTFNDITVYVPNKYHEYLTICWGDYMKLPPINQRYPHEGRISFSIPQWMKVKYPNLYKY